MYHNEGVDTYLAQHNRTFYRWHTFVSFGAFRDWPNHISASLKQVIVVCANTSQVQYISNHAYITKMCGQVRQEMI